MFVFSLIDFRFTEIMPSAKKFQNLPLDASTPLRCPYTVSASDSICIYILNKILTIDLLFARKQGTTLLNDPVFNKGSAFTPEERQRFQLHGLLPPNVQSLDDQVRRAYQQYQSKPDDLAKNTFMASMKEQNEVLFYKVGVPFEYIRRYIPYPSSTMYTKVVTS